VFEGLKLGSPDPVNVTELEEEDPFPSATTPTATATIATPTASHTTHEIFFSALISGYLR
jgi:hypothetical protein